jgi:predicted lipoprotein with Yx(FWY)xxD motif
MANEEGNMRNLKIVIGTSLAAAAFGALAACSGGEAVSSAKVAVTSSIPSTAPATTTTSGAQPSAAAAPPPATAGAPATATRSSTAKPSAATSAPKAAPAQDLAVAANAKLGTIVTDGAGLTVYRLDADTAKPSKSNCAGDCAKRFPPVLVPAGATARVQGIDPALVGTVARADGTTQVTLAGRPVYRYAGDTVPGDTAGHGFAGAFAMTVTGAKATAR